MECSACLRLLEFFNRTVAASNGDSGCLSWKVDGCVLFELGHRQRRSREDEARCPKKWRSTRGRGVVVVVSVSGWGSIQTPHFQESDAWNNIPLSIMKRSSSHIIPREYHAPAEQCFERWPTDVKFQNHSWWMFQSDRFSHQNGLKLRTIGRPTTEPLQNKKPEIFEKLWIWINLRLAKPPEFDLISPLYTSEAISWFYPEALWFGVRKTVASLGAFHNVLSDSIRGRRDQFCNRGWCVLCILWCILPPGKTNTYGCFRKLWYPRIIHFNRVFHYKPSILGYPYLWKHPYNMEICNSTEGMDRFQFPFARSDAHFLVFACFSVGD